MESKDSAVSSTGGSAEKPSPLWRGFFMKPFKTIDEQIAILKQRGLLIPNEIRARFCLLENNYYNIINGYSKFFPMQGDIYTNGTTFDEVICLYMIDSEIKQAFFKAILTAESHLKSIFSYRFAQEFPQLSYPYLDILCYDPQKTLDVMSTIHRLSGIINRQSRIRQSSISHYLSNYGNVPIWVLIGYLDFGELRYMLDSTHTHIQNNVAKDMMMYVHQHIPACPIFPPEIMLAFLANINELRNVCAHNNRMIGFQCRRDDKYFQPLHSLHGISATDSRRDAYSVYLSLQCFMGMSDFAKLHNTLRKRIRYFSHQLQTINMADVLIQLGFPCSWHTTASKLPQ